MRTSGIVCEYNPFHRGHAYQIQKTKENADAVICVMSGAVTQRGTFARHDKWSRARTALENGADIVLELPVRFACASAGEFARGGVGTLMATGLVDQLSFGCEKEAIPLLEAAAKVLKEEPDGYRLRLKAELDAGESYAAAQAKALEEVLNMPGAGETLMKPNSTLALAYLSALPERVQAVPVARIGSGYHEEQLGAFSSATAIRKALEAGRTEEAIRELPGAERIEEMEKSGASVSEDALEQVLLYKLRTMTPQQLAGIAGIGEGLEYRMIEAARRVNTRAELLECVKTRRYTYTRLSRICMHVLMETTADLMRGNNTPSYLRLLGFRRDAVQMLHEMKRTASLPIITKAADYVAEDPLFQMDVRAQDLWALACSKPAGMDFVTSPVIL